MTAAQRNKLQKTLEKYMEEFEELKNDALWNVAHGDIEALKGMDCSLSECTLSIAECLGQLGVSTR